MNIGMVCYPTHGGSGIVATELAKELGKLGHEVHIISFALPIRVTPGLRNIFFHKVEVSAYPLFKYPPYSLEVTAMIADVARNHNLDVVHVHYAIPHGMSAWAAREMLAEEGVRLPFITTLHGTDITVVGSEPTMAQVTRFILRHSNAVTAVSDWLRGETERFFDMRCPIFVIPNFIDPQAFRRQRRTMQDGFAAPGEKLMLHVSNFRPVKNVPDIIRVLHHAARRIACRLVVVGDGPDRPHAEQLARDLGVSDRVTFVGMQSNVLEYLSMADLYLMSSSSESFGLSALEAMSCGVPVVAYRVGGMPEVILDGRTGLLVAPGDAAALGEAAVMLLEDDARRRRFGRAARRRVLEEFTAERIVRQYEALYRAVVERRPCIDMVRPGGSGE
jgi:N-acetyl-alpha-D-glucosaminyl L-malate synthase BshA